MLLPDDKRPAIHEVLKLRWINQHKTHITRVSESYPLENKTRKSILEMQKLDHLKKILSKHDNGNYEISILNHFKPKPKFQITQKNKPNPKVNSARNCKLKYELLNPNLKAKPRIFKILQNQSG